MIESELYEHIRSSVPLVGGRVYANIMAQDTQKPALVYTVIKEDVRTGVVSCASDDGSRNRREWMIHTYHESYSANKEVKEEVVAALRSFGHAVFDISIEDGFDEETELYVQLIKFYTGR
jgi:hypothetical protein